MTRASYAFHNIDMKGCPAWTSGNKIINFCSSHARWIIQTPFFWSTKINLVILFPSFDNLAFNQWWRGWPSSRDVGSLYARLRNYWASHWTQRNVGRPWHLNSYANALIWWFTATRRPTFPFPQAYHELDLIGFKVSILFLQAHDMLIGSMDARSV